MPNRKKAKSSKGRRYTPEEKATIIEHVEKVNASKGRGGQTAAAKKFGISMLTISSWMKKPAEGAAAARGAGKSKSVNGALAKLASIHTQIEAKERELVTLRQQFDALKRTL
jgi:transposase-like protein